MVTRNPELVDATDLDAYAELRPREAQELLPHLIRRLLANTPGVTGVSVRAGSSIGMTGYDGQAHGGEGTSFVPAGPGVWELGTSGNPRKKAQDDYRDRKKNPLGVDPAVTAFITVSLRKWDELDRQRWLTLRNKEKLWRSVVALDADDLDGWLDETRAVRIWVSEQMGRRPRDVATLDLWWQHWAGATRPALPTALLLAGRRTQTDQLRTLLRGACAAHGVVGPSRAEALAFVAAALIPEGTDTAETDGEIPVLVVSSAEEWRRLIDGAVRTALVPEFSTQASDVAEAVRAGHHVIIPMSPDDNLIRMAIALPRIARDAGRDALLASGWSFDRADHDAAQARRSLQSLRRDPRLAVSPQLERPPWSQRPAADVIAPLVLVGNWRSVDLAGEPSSADRAIVARIAGTDYDSLERDLGEWAELGDPPVHRSGQGWRLAAPIDAWTLLRRTLSAADLSRWSTAAIEVLTELDPALNMPPAERPFAGVRGICRSWSARLRHGLAQGAAILGAAGDERVGDRRAASEYASQIVRELLVQANADESGQLWQSLSDVLPLVAEAAPDQFLDAVDEGLAASPPLLSRMFGDATADRGWGTTSVHTGLLWALETLCWSPGYLPGATDALAHLAKIDPGGRLSNRPPDSLRRVFLPWRPCTSAPPEQRLAVLAGLADRYPSVAFPLLVSLLPVTGDSTHPTAAPRFRDWRPDTEVVTLTEHLQMLVGVVDQILVMLRDDPTRWVGILNALHSLPHDQLGRFLDELELATPDGLPDGARRPLWDELTDLTAKHRQFHETKWALPDELLRRFETIADRLEPSDDAARHARLFDWHPDLPGTDKWNHDSYDKALRQAQRTAVSEALAAAGLQSLRALAAASKLPRMVGAVAAETGTEELGTEILQGLEQEGAQAELAVGWVMRMAEINGQTCGTDMAASLTIASEHGRALFFFALPVTESTWSLVDADTQGVQEEYWQSVRAMSASPDDVEALAGRLLEWRKPWAVINLLSAHIHRTDDHAKPSPELIQRALRAVLEPNLSETLPPGSLDYALGSLLDYLAAAGTDPDVMFELEWAYLPLLQWVQLV